MDTRALEDRRRRLCEWLEANGVDPGVMPEDGPVKFERDGDGQVILHYTVYEFDDDGRPKLECGEIVRSRRAAPLTVPPPSELGIRFPA
ncbi:hypothetical protein LUW77_03625 [Streptomyces radiopugnans]|nr:hypothetical protein LUW77_03625 [Streptomyces radiopugnans]